MSKTSAKTLYNEIEFNERRLLLLLSNDLLWFKKNLVNIKSHKNRKAFLKKKTDRYNQILKTTEELSKISNSLTRTDSEILTSPYVYLEQEKLAAQKVKIKNDIKVKNLSKPKLFEVISFTHFVDLFNNPKSRKYPKDKCVEIVKKKILDKNNNMPSNILARDFYINNKEEAEAIVNGMYINSALYLKKDMEQEMQASLNRKKKKQQEQAIEAHNLLNKKAQTKETKKEVKTNSKAPKEHTNTVTKQAVKQPKVKYNSASKAYESVSENDDEKNL